MNEFPESELNKSVFTTKFVMNKNSPVVYVAHDTDGDWQFFGPEDNIKDEDVMIVSLEQMIDHDPSLRSLYDLPVGMNASRSKKGEEFRRSKIN